MARGSSAGTMMPRPVALAVLAAALLLRVLVPAGWMPAIGGDGVTRITLCTPNGVAEAWVDAEGAIHDKKPHDKSAGDQPCAFSGLAMAGDLPALHTDLTPPTQGATAVPAFSPAVGIGRGLAAPPPPATGPPAFA